MSKKLLMIATAFDFKNDKLHNKNKCLDETRINHYINGLKKLFSYHTIDKFDLLLVDNTIKNEEGIDQRIRDILPSRTIFRFCPDNDSSNIGKGVILSWKYVLEDVKKYEYVIHFEPRQLLLSDYFFNHVLSMEKNVFKIWYNNTQIWTGLFCIKSNLLEQYVLSQNLRGSIENDLYIFIKTSKVDFIKIEKLDLKYTSAYDNTETLL